MSGGYASLLLALTAVRHNFFLFFCFLLSTACDGSNWNESRSSAVTAAAAAAARDMNHSGCSLLMEL